MEVFDKLKDKITETSQTVVKKTKDTTEILKLNNTIKANEKEIEGQFFKIGVKYYAENKDNYPEVYKEFFQTIDVLQKEINDRRAQIETLSIVCVCEKCGRKVGENSKFCIYCGTPVVKEEQHTVLEHVRCDSCGKEIESDAVFCTYCGNNTVNKEGNGAEAETMQESSVTCRGCGAVLEEDAMFCTECGAEHQQL